MRSWLSRLLLLLLLATCAPVVGGTKVRRDLPRLLAAKGLIEQADDAAAAAPSEGGTPDEAASRLAISADAADFGADLSDIATQGDTSAENKPTTVAEAEPTPSSAEIVAKVVTQTDMSAVAGWEAREANTTDEMKAQLRADNEDIATLRQDVTSAADKRHLAKEARAQAERLKKHLEPAALTELRAEVEKQEAELRSLNKAVDRHHTLLAQAQARVNVSRSEVEQEEQAKVELLSQQARLQGLQLRQHRAASVARQLLRSIAKSKRQLALLHQATADPKEQALNAALVRVDRQGMRLKEEDVAVQRRTGAARAQYNQQLMALNLHVSAEQAKVTELEAAERDAASDFANAKSNLTAQEQEGTQLARAVGELQQRTRWQAPRLRLQARKVEGALRTLHGRVSQLQEAVQHIQDSAPTEVQGIAQQLATVTREGKELRQASTTTPVAPEGGDSTAATFEAVAAPSRDTSPKALRLWQRARQLVKQNTVLRRRLINIERLLKKRRHSQKLIQRTGAAESRTSSTQ